MIFSLWPFLSCTKPPVAPTSSKPVLSIATPDLSIDRSLIPAPLDEPVLDNLNQSWFSHPMWFYQDTDAPSHPEETLSDWRHDEVRLWATTPCLTGPIHWQNPQDDTQGTVDSHGGQLWLTVPKRPNAFGIQLVLSCDEWSEVRQWSPNDSSPLPTVQGFSINDDSTTIQIQAAENYRLEIETEIDGEWQIIQSNVVLKPIERLILTQKAEQTVRYRWRLHHTEDPDRPYLSGFIDPTDTPIQSIHIRHTPNFLHLGDIIAARKIHDTTQGITETQEWLSSSSETMEMILPLPSDQIAGTWQQTGFINTEEQYDIPMTSSGNANIIHFRTDTQAADERLVQLLPLLSAPPTPDNLATILYHTAVYWDALSDKELPWTLALLNRGHQAIQYFDQIQQNDWTAWSFETQMRVILAALASSHNAQPLSSRSMHLLLQNLCQLPATDIPKDAALMGHVQWLIQEQSHWKHLACPISHPRPVWSDSVVGEHAQLQQDAIEQSVKEWVHYPMPSIDEVHSWWLWSYENDLSKRYTNLSLSLRTEQETNRGRFHEWQFQPVVADFAPDTTGRLTVSGVGRLYLSEWQTAPSTLEAHQDDTLQIHRSLRYADGTHLDPNRLQIYDPIVIQHIIHSKPNIRICLNQWGASGLTPTQPQSQTCQRTDDNGRWAYEQTVWVAFDGRFKLPASIVSDGKVLAHTADTWLQTVDYTTRSPKSENVIE